MKGTYISALKGFGSQELPGFFNVVSFVVRACVFFNSFLRTKPLKFRVGGRVCDSPNDRDLVWGLGFLKFNRSA